MKILIILGIIFIGLILLVVGIAALTLHDDALMADHPPDPDHRQWPQDGDD